jgi:Holliday junction resolvase RusA-like endonuclease
MNRSKTMLENLLSLQSDQKPPRAKTLTNIRSTIPVITLTGAVVPKARARHRGNQSYLPANYRQWKDSAIAELRCQYHGSSLPKAAVRSQIHGSARGDLDNLAGAVLDALVQSGLLVDDRISCVPQLEVKHVSGKHQGASIQLEAL